MSGSIMGCYGSKMAFCSHIGECNGVLCTCQNMVAHFLNQTTDMTLDTYVHDNVSYMRENVKFPYLLILSADADFVVVTAYAAHDFQVARLDGGHYLIRYNLRTTQLTHYCLPPLHVLPNSTSPFHP
jgi:hypothetical protein